MNSISQFLLVGLFLVLHPFCVSAQIPNASFESWDSLNPQSWVTNNNDLIVPPYQIVMVRKDTITPYDGLNAMVIQQNWAYSGWAKTTFDDTSHPSHLNAFVKFNVHAIDTVSIRIELMNNGVVVDSGYWTISDTIIDEWTPIQVPISQSILEVFETTILIEGGRVTGPADETSVLMVDNLSLGYSPLGEPDELINGNSILVFPNPSDGIFRVVSRDLAMKIEKVSVYTVLGEKILESDEASINLQELGVPSGCYYLSIQTNSGKYTREIILSTKH